jgi:hypothetical protein
MLRDPKTGRYVYRLKGEVVNAETFWATALASTITNVFVILLAAKGLGISKRRAWALVAAANAWRAMNDLRVDVASTPKPDRFEAARARAGLN